MKFVIIHQFETNTEILIPVDRIISLHECDDGTCFVELHIDKKDSCGYFTAELYSEIKFQLLNKLRGDLDSV